MYMAIPKSCLPNRRDGFGLLLRWFSGNLELDIILMSLEPFYCWFIEPTIHNDADLHFDFNFISSTHLYKYHECFSFFRALQKFFRIIHQTRVIEIDLKY